MSMNSVGSEVQCTFIFGLRRSGAVSTEGVNVVYWTFEAKIENKG